MGSIQSRSTTVHKHSPDDVQAIIDDLPTLPTRLKRGERIAILQAVAHEPGWVESEGVAVHAQEFLRIWEDRLMTEVV